MIVMGSQLQLGGIPGFVKQRTKNGIVFFFDRKVKFHKGGISTREWYLAWWTVKELVNGQIVEYRVPEKAVLESNESLN